MATSHSDTIAGGAVRAAHLLPVLPVAGAVIPTLPVAVATWDEAYVPLDAMLIWDDEHVAQATMGSLHRMLEPLLASNAQRMHLVVAAQLAPLPDGCSAIAGQRRQLHWNAIQSALITVQELGIGVSYCNDEQLVPHCTMVLARDRRPIVARRGYHPMGDRIAWLAGIGGIGIDTARVVVEYCGGDIAAALMALTDPTIPPPTGITAGRWHSLQRTCRRWLGFADGIRLQLDIIQQEAKSDGT